jgi:Flp pilus assembly protein TadD
MGFALGGLQFKNGKFKEAAKLMRAIVRIDPLDSRASALLKHAERALEQKAASNG